MTRGLAWISAGVPSAIFSPKLMQTMRSEIFITAGMSCSTSSTVTPRSSRRRRTSATIFIVSSWFIPAKGSSSKITSGRVASPIAMPKARKCPCGRFDAISLRIVARPRKSMMSSAEVANPASSARACAEPKKNPRSEAFDRK